MIKFTFPFFGRVITGDQRTADFRDCHPDAALVATPTAETTAKLCAFAAALASQAPGKLVGGEKTWDARIKIRGFVLCILCHTLKHYMNL